MRITRIGSWVFDNNTNVVLDSGLDQELPGVGVELSALWQPRDLVIRLMFQRSSRNAALQAANEFLRDVAYAMTRYNPAVGTLPPSIVMNFDGVYTSYLANAIARVQSITSTSVGTAVMLELRGVLLYPPAGSTSQLTVSNVDSFATTVQTLGSDASTLRLITLSLLTPTATSIIDSLLLIESLAPSDTPQHRVVSPSSAASNFTAETMPSGHTRYRMASGTGGTINYTITVDAILARIPYTVWMCIQASAPCTATVSWTTLPTRIIPITTNRTWYPIAVHDWPFTHTISITLTNAGINTYVYPLMFVPFDVALCAYVRGANQYNRLFIRPFPLPALAVSNQPNASIFMARVPVTRHVIALTHGIAVTTLSTATTTYDVFHAPIAPVSFV